MSLRLRALRLRAQTERGEFGRDFEFHDGLVVLRAENSMGKTTAANAIVYALGMDGLIAQRHDVPLTAAMTNQLLAPDGATLSVIESLVQLEVENRTGHLATLERYAKRRSGDTRMIRVWDGRRVTNPSPDDTYTDKLARVSGSGTGEVAIGQWLEDFVGWDLPTIAMPDGGERRLYPELLLSLIFVEQRAGWRGVQAAMPTYGIPDARKRAREYVLGLTVYARERRRLELNREFDELRRAWTSALKIANARLEGAGVRLARVPGEVDADFDENSPVHTVDLSTGRTLEAELTVVAEALAAMSESSEPSRDAETVSGDEARLAELEEQLQVLALDFRERQRHLARLQDQLAELSDQSGHLSEDLRRNDDARRLQSFGGDSWANDDRDCPTCHQQLPATLLGTLDRPTMTVEQNIAYLRQQIDVVEAARARAVHEIEVTTQTQVAVRRTTSDVRSTVRALRDALVRPAGAPSAAEIQQRLLLERRLDELRAAETEVGALRNELAEIAARASANRAALAGVPRSTLTDSDEATIATLERSFLEQLRAYRPESLPVDDLGISRDSYLPVAGDVDLAFQISASDGIRLIWAYLLGMLETSRSTPTNHPGVVIFDEPRQQSARDESLRMLLRRAAEAKRAGQQVLFATSEPVARLEPMLDGLELQYLPIEGRLLVPPA